MPKYIPLIKTLTNSIILTTILTTMTSPIIAFGSMSNISYKEGRINNTTSVYYFDNGSAQAQTQLNTELANMYQTSWKSSLKINTFRPEIFNIDTNGNLKQQSWLKSSYLANYRKNAQFIIPTIKGDAGWPSGGIATWHLLVMTPAKRASAIKTIMDFISVNNLDGIEIDFEPSFVTSPTSNGQKLSSLDYNNMLTFLDELGSAFLPLRKKLNIAIPPMFNWSSSDQLYSYNSFIDRPGLMSKLNLITLMAYDLNYGNDYISTNPTPMYRELLQIAKNQFGIYQEKIVIGLNSYGTCKNPVTRQVQPLQGPDIRNKAGWGNWITDPKYRDGGDLTFWSGTQVCSYPDKTTHRARIAIAREYGFWQFVFWSAGAGNDWVN